MVNATTEHAVHGLATRMALPNLVGSLLDVLGQRLTAVAAGVSDAKAVGKWSRGERSPHPDVEQRLRNTFQVVQLLLQHESAETVRAWFVGMNPYLGDQAPALVIGVRPDEVLQAARAFVTHG